MLEQAIAKPPAGPRANNEVPHPSRVHFGKASTPAAQPSRKNPMGCFCSHQKDAWSGIWKSSRK